MINDEPLQPNEIARTIILTEQKAQPKGTPKIWRDGLERAEQIMDYENFDYFNGTLTEWLDKFFNQDTTRVSEIENEYLPRFEQAIWRKAAKLNSFGIAIDASQPPLEENGL